jgi:hypothetical protein
MRKMLLYLASGYNRLRSAMKRWLFLLPTLLLAGCGKYYLSVQQQWIDINYLASTQVRTPDPLRANPPLGQMLIIDWKIPRELLKEKPYILLDLIFWDYTTHTLKIPIEHQMNYTTYELLDQEYEKKGGILTYKAAIANQDGTLFRESKHQLWVNLIRIEE